MLEKITNTVKDRSANCTVIMTTIGTMESGVIQTSRTVQMPKLTGYFPNPNFPGMELAELLVSKVNICNMYQGWKSAYFYKC